RLRRVELRRPARLGCPRALGEAKELGREHGVDTTVASQCLGPQVALDPEDVCLAVVGQAVLPGEDRRVERVVAMIEACVPVVVERDELERLPEIYEAAPVETRLLRVLV